MPATSASRICARSIRDRDTLCGRYDPGALRKEQPLRDEMHSLYKIDVIAYCMSESESRRDYDEAGEKHALIEVDHRLLSASMPSSLQPQAARECSRKPQCRRA